MNSAAPVTVVAAAEEPILAELFSPERLEQHAESLAAAQTVGSATAEGESLIDRVRENGRLLLEYYRAIGRAIQREQVITPAAQWLVDNFYIVEEQLREVRDDLPPGFYRKLPKLNGGHLKGYPRVYGIAWAFVAHTDSRFDPELLRRFVVAYQRVQPLMIGELWAVAITLRVVLIENLRRLAARIVLSRDARSEADLVADRLLGTAGQEAVSPETVLKQFEKKPLERAFAVQLIQRLRDLDPKVGPILVWLDERLEEQGTSADEIVRAEHQQQAVISVTARNIINSMRLTSSFDWNTFFEEVSIVDVILREGSDFERMDFPTRDSYRHAIEKLADGSRLSQIEIAQRAVDYARQGMGEGNTAATRPEVRYLDPGYYLVSDGRRRFEHDIGYKVPSADKLTRLYAQSAAGGYIGGIALLTALLLIWPLWHCVRAGLGAGHLLLLAILAVIPASDLAIALINRMVTDMFGPRTIPRLEIKTVPDDLRTMVAIPALLTSKDAIIDLVDHLEIHYLANPDDNLRFALLTDWLDASNESMPGDELLLQVAQEGIARLNERHGSPKSGGPRFFILHRKRLWNPSEEKWMGWERKRGKLHELNRLLRGATDTTYITEPAEHPGEIPPIRYVITLDADTRLPRGAARRLIGTMAHPLNHARYDARLGRVVEGYGIVQPRVTPSLPTEREGSIFQRIFSGPAGIDPYSSAVSDVYQDLFQEGSYTGKGIYDVDVYETALAGKIPDNILLSHDLFEGIFARSALASDIELFDDFPSHYEEAAARHYRWARGDWQLAGWILTGKAGPAHGPKVSIPIMGRWKMLDNLRRSLVAPTMFLTMLVGWLLPKISPWYWMGFVVLMIAIPALTPFFGGLDVSWGGISKRSHFRDLLSDLTLGLTQTALALVFLAYQAWLMMDAIVRTLVRVRITHKHMLEWMTAAQAKHTVDLKLPGMFRRMGGAIVLGAIAVVAVILSGNHYALTAAIPLVIVWCASPVVAYRISLPPPQTAVEQLPTATAESLRLVARRTWRYFETLVTEQENFLPPDNFQEDPKPIVAPRTSPTNIGLYLLSTLAARDFHWIGTLEFVDRVEATLNTMDKMVQFRGHLYNWYNTRTLQTLEPRYISSVDSGNLAGHLLALSSGCRDLLETTCIEAGQFTGVSDALQLLRGALESAANPERTHVVPREHLSTAVEVLATALHSPPADLPGLGAKLQQISASASTVADIAQTLAQELHDAASEEVQKCAQAVLRCVESQSRDARVLLPWLRLNPPGVAAHFAGSGGTQSPEWAAIREFFPRDATLATAPDRFARAVQALTELRVRLQGELRPTAPTGAAARAVTVPSTEEIARVDALIQWIRQSAAEAAALQKRLLELADRTEAMFEGMDFAFLYDPSRKLFSIGYRASDGQLDSNYYDLLASEARLASFIAIAKGDVPSTHWFQLGRSLTPVGKGSALISWSGSMFEYLMPALAISAPKNSLLTQTKERVVARQIEYGNERGVPWGISESAFAARDLQFNYQYQAFGVPGLGLKRGLSEDLVIAPYATALAAMVNPEAAARNFERIEKEGGRGQYGMFEALDYTSSRLAEGQKVAIVKAFFAHHQGMSIAALANAVLNNAMANRFHEVPIVQATELLLQERTPRNVLVARPRAEEVSAAARVRELIAPTVRKFTNPHEATPRTLLLSNGRYVVMLTSAGSGYSRCRDIAVTRWREDLTRDCWGSYIYLRDEQTGSVWSAGFQPTGMEPTNYEASFYEDHAEFVRRDRSLITKMEVIVSPEDDAEIRRISITNSGIRGRDIQVTSFSELSLTTQAADTAHPAFTNLFVETEFVEDMGVLLATRRKRSPEEAPIWAAHLVTVEGGTVGELQYETDRARFIGRTRDWRHPISIIDGRPLSNTAGPVLDPVLSLRRTVHIPPGTAVHLLFSTVVATSREDVLNLADKYRDASTYDRIKTLAWTQSQVELHHLGISTEEAQLFQRLANAVIYSDATLRPSPALLATTTLEKSTLWAQGISGDLPIVMARIDDADDFEMIRQLLRAHEYWRMKQLSADVVIINDRASSYAQDLQGSLEALVRGSQLRLAPDSLSASGKIFLLRADLLSPQAQTQIQAVARAVLLSRRGTIAEQISRSRFAEPAGPAIVRTVKPVRSTPTAIPALELEFFNGLGGFADNGREYTIALSDGLRTPEPWSNIVANPNFGFLATESGSGFTWSMNSHENQITPWSNDHVIDPPGEAIYLRDENSGEIWTPTALPIRREEGAYYAHHGQGYTRFAHSAYGIAAELTQFVPVDDSIKISRLTLRNESGANRRISVTAYVEWLLGSTRTSLAPYVVTEVDPSSRAVMAHSMWGGEFGGRVAFADFGGLQQSFTCDRTEFLGRNGSLEMPAAMQAGHPLSGRLGAGLDPCAALQATVEIRAGATVEIRFLLGQAENKEQASTLIAKYRAANLNDTLQEVVRQWDDILGGVEINTPERSMDILLNRWLLYQTLCCRVWARAAFYQLSGAYGFRDQLQDVMAVTVAKRSVTREHLLRAAARQFPEGDVQHWWHPPSGKGIRTRMSDDLLWLPYAVINFIEATNDMAVLDEMVPFLEGEQLAANQHEAYFEPRVSDMSGTLYEHCARAIDHSLGVGVHGIPLMGTGDWNDGMNRVGQDGKGESIWLGWFLHTVLWEFAKIADSRGESKRAETWRLQVVALKAALEREGWDGEWYRRAYYDDGTPLGSAANEECRIDSIAQSWAVISGGAEPNRAGRAMGAVEKHLLRRQDGLILLLSPPFDKGPKDPGYIKGYVPGIRENGGQYSHAAVWTLIAFAAMSDGDKTGELFRMMNPINKSDSRAKVQKYKIEPYVVAGDIYAEPPHVGRGGWTWYTGTAGWLYRAGIEWILGFRIRGMMLNIDPCIPRSWPGYTMKFRYHSATYTIQVQNPSSVCRGVALTEMDGKILAGPINMPLEDDGKNHVIRIVLG